VVAYGRRPKRNQKESAYVSRQRTWRTLPEPSSVFLNYASALGRKDVNGVIRGL
jgi:hypothetical protein